MSSLLKPNLISPMASFDYQSDCPDGVLDAYKKYSHPLVDRVSKIERNRGDNDDRL